MAPERGRRVLVRRYGIDGRETTTLKELAEELGLSRERVKTQLSVSANRRAG